MSSFFSEGNGTDQGYVNVRDVEDERFADARAYTESLWADFSRFADSQFLREAKDNFTERFWEMYLGCTLMDCGYAVGTPGDEGPDLYAQVNNRRFWFEATAPSEGTADDRVPQPIVGKAQIVPVERIVLRLTGAIKEKSRHFDRARMTGVVLENEGCVICVNGRQIPSTAIDDVPPLILQAVFPIGNPQIIVDRYTKEVLDSGFEDRSYIKKASGSAVSTRGFIDRSLAKISAVIYSRVDCANHPTRLGDDFICVHNPNANHPLPIGFLNRGVEYWAQDDDTLTSRDFSVYEQLS